MPFTQTTLGDFIGVMGEILQDTGHVWWTQADITSAVKEGLRLWGAATGFWKDRGVFTASVAGFYDLSAQLPLLRSQAVTVGDVLTDVELALQESQFPTAQFTTADLRAAVVRARNQFCLDAKVPLRVDTLASVPPPFGGRVILTDDIAGISRLAWTDGPSGRVSVLRREDPWSLAGLDTSGIALPIAYSQTETPPLEIILSPGPVNSGDLKLITLKTLALVNDGDSLALPDEFTPAVKYGALAEVLGTSGPGADDFRSAYARERYRSIVEIAKTVLSTLWIFVNGVRLRMDTLAALDSGQPFWEMTSPLAAGVLYDLIAVPAGSITVDVIRAAPVPSALGDFVQLGREELAYLADYCRHALTFKVAGEELRDSMDSYKSWISGMGQRGRLLSERTKYLEAIFDKPQEEESVEHVA